uniref:Uncharacterized protein n=1 Tax=Magallana gigas TaxID=29159 RepID=A0A8W8LV38_MAGGI
MYLNSHWGFTLAIPLLWTLHLDKFTRLRPDNGDRCLYNRTFVHSPFERLSRSTEFLNFLKPHTVCFIRENDLCHADPRKVTTEILSYAEYLNEGLKSETEKLHGIHFWSHRGFWADLTYLGRDGGNIESGSRHMKKYHHNIRIAVLQHSR